jgi:hypothetical protein
MKKEIHKLRVKIDSLAKLVESLDVLAIIVDENNVMENVTIENISEAFRKMPVMVMKQLNAKPIKQVFNYNLYECQKSLRLAKAWLGKVLAELGEETPYKKDGKRKSVNDIEETDDSANRTEDFPIAPEEWADDLSNVTFVEKIDFLREEINNVILLLNKVWEGKKVLSDDELASYLIGDGLTFLGNSEHCLMEARFHLRFELQKIRKESKMPED